MNVDEALSSLVVTETVPLIQCQQLEAGDGMDVDAGFGAGGHADAVPCPVFLRHYSS
jgi:hypothetical protein